MKNKFNKKEIKFYINNFKKLMNMVDAEQCKNNECEYIMKTNYGKLSIYIDDLENCHCGIVAIHTCFDEPEKAKDKFNCNPYTGKWNFYDYDVKSALEVLYGMICDVLDKENIGEFI